MKFQRSISSFTLLFSAVGGIVGSGWLFGPLYAAQIAGPAAILSWIVGGAMMMIIAFTFAELATAFPVAGGMVRFAEFSHGPLLSFTVGWLVWLSSVVVAPVETLALIQYAANYLPGLVHKVGTAPVLTMTGIIVAAIIMLIMNVVNIQGAKFFSRSTTSIVTIKLIVPLLTLLTLFYLDFHGSNLTAHGFAPYGIHGIFAALPLGGVIFSFIGYSPAIQLAEETKNPKRAIPLAIIGSLSICIILYSLLQLAFVGALSPQDLAQGWNKLSFIGDNGPFAGILAAFGVAWLVMIIYADAVVSPFGTAFIYTAATARVNYAMCQTGFFPDGLKKLNKHGVPVRSMIMNYIVGLLLFLPFPGWQSMVGFIVSCFVISHSIGPLALITLRKLRPGQARTFRLPFANIFCLVAFYICNLLIYWTGWQTVSRLLIALALGFMVFIYRALRSQIDNHRSHWQRAWWLLPYLMGIGFISYFGTFGGGTGHIKFGVDFIWLAVLSILVYYAALGSAGNGSQE